MLTANKISKVFSIVLILLHNGYFIFRRFPGDLMQQMSNNNIQFSMSRHVICHDINYIYFDSTLMFTIHIINVINVEHSSKTSTLMLTFKTTLFMIFNSYLAICYIIINAEVCIIRDFLCHNIKQAMSYHNMEFYVTTCCMSQLSRHPYYLVAT